ncbi:MAG: hypothetical protein F6K50_39670 [Moorea sp. SIO3I7]|uniref:hypothetical protein n=1 Tax=Moorena bouillonii TaxID=207920 RepID=UPI0013013BD1|nr:hypothetical protein [Moorena bouillonii]NEO01309.1 hypothetical protein [Moorena sp. SIO3I7]
MRYANSLCAIRTLREQPLCKALGCSHSVSLWLTADSCSRSVAYGQRLTAYEC